VGGVSGPAAISEALGRAGLWLTELTPLTPDLESVFLDLTGTRPLPGDPSGWVGETDAAFWAGLGTLCARGIALAVASAGCAFALATLARRTAAALGIAVGYFLIWEAGGRIVFEITGMLPYDPYFLSSYLAAFLNGDLRYWPGLDGAGDLVITLLGGGMVLAVLTAALTAAAFASFHRRDLV
jgi:hypothetical protein